MLTYVLSAILAVVVLFLVVVALQSNEFCVERQATIPAPAADVFLEVVDLHRWREWSPWEEIDPNLKRTYEGADLGTGAVYSWAGDRNVGEGRMTILDTRPNELIRIRLDFYKPFAATNTAEFKFEPLVDHQTRVTWSMYGPKNFFAKALHLCISMDKMIGGQFEKGLVNLKNVVASKISASAPASA